MPELSLITTCRSRLAHLQQSLPTFVAQPATECIVVDYDCPEATGDWVARNYPQVKVVRTGSQPVFEAARARNLGAAVAESPRLCFVDADVCLADGFAEEIGRLLAPRRFLRAHPVVNEIFGTIVCWRDDFQRIGGFDEVMQGWGNEDIDLLFRLELAGSRVGSYPAALLQPIPHADELRVKHHVLQDMWLNCAINKVYMRIKRDLMWFEAGELPIERRRQLYSSIRASILDSVRSGRPLRLTVPTPADEAGVLGPFERSLVYVLPQIGRTNQSRAPSGDKPAEG